MPAFVHLHTHSHYSLLDGLGKIPELLDRASELGMDALALTDHGVLHGLVEFWKEARKRDIRPILGVEAYLVPNRRRYRESLGTEKKIRHLTLLAEDNAGYQNLLKLLTDAHLHGFYRKPCVDYDTLKAWSGGLIALSGCLKGDLPQAIIRGDRDEAERLIAWHLETFGRDRFFLELQHHPTIPQQGVVNETLKDLARIHGIGLVATGDVHYVRPEDAEAQDVLLCVQTGTKVTDKDRLSMLGEDFSLKTPAEMTDAFRGVPEALANTLRIADRCRVELKFGTPILPEFPLPGGETKESCLRRLCEEGRARRYGHAPSPAVRDRLAYELNVIEKTGFAGYFLIVQDFVNWAKRQGIFVGPGRGSAAGSLVSYVVGITDLDPLTHQLVFERFLNPERISMPDIDLDFADDRREEVLQYVLDRYGRDHVAQIITFGTMAARAAVRDVGRALGYPYTFCDKAAKLIPFGMSLDEAQRASRDLQRLAAEDPQVQRLLRTARKLEGVARHSSTHAAGVVITPTPLVEHVPLQRASADDFTTITQYDMRAVEDLGLLKIDFLGLKNLTILQHCLRLIRERTGEEHRLEKLPLDDQATFRLLQDALTTGVFQLESAGMKRYLKELKPTEFEDIVAMVSLYRPGPMEFIPQYIAGKHGLKTPQYLHPALKPILEKTYGIAVYQEQVLEIARAIAGFTLGEADILRKAVGKKIEKLLKEQRERFMAGAARNDVDRRTAERIFEFIEPFADYGFNRCLAGDTRIVDAETGVPRTIREMARNAAQNGPEVFTLDETLGVVHARTTNVYQNGKQQVYCLRTRSGREIRATANHPFRTMTGWRSLGTLSVGEPVAVPRTIPEPQRTVSRPPHELTVLGYLLAAGNLCHPSGFYVYTEDKTELRDYVRALERFPNTRATVDRSRPGFAIYARPRNLREPCGAVQWLDTLGVKGQTATKKIIPEIVFRLPKQELALFLTKLFQGDGRISVKRPNPEIYYATSSPELVRQLQHLFLRLDIVATIHKKMFPDRGPRRPGSKLNISRHENIRRFVEMLGPHFVSAKKEAIKVIARTHPVLLGLLEPGAARGRKDTIPVAVGSVVRPAVAASGRSPLAFSPSTGVAWRPSFDHAQKTGYFRETTAKIGTALPYEELNNFANSDVYWDEVAEITREGWEETYDLTVAGTHNYVANDIVVHNSHAVCYALLAYQTAYLKTHYPAAFMAALLTSDENDTDRIAIEVAECVSMGIQVLPPDVNESGLNFTVVAQPKEQGTRNKEQARAGADGSLPTPNTLYPLPSTDAIRFGLLAVKNVGRGVVEAILAARNAGGKFRTLGDFFQRTQTREFNKKAAESLAKAGAFDALAERNQLLENLNHLLQLQRHTQRQEAAGQGALFSAGNADEPMRVTLRPAPAAPPEQRLRWEKELLGLYVSGHPLAGVAHLLVGRTTPIKELTSDLTDYQVRIGGIVGRVQRVVTRSQETMAFATVEDQTGSVEVLVFPRTLEATADLWKEEQLLLIEGKISDRDGVLKIICEDAQRLAVDSERRQVETLVPSFPGREPEEFRIFPDALPRPSVILLVSADRGKETLLTLRSLLHGLPPGPSRVYLRLLKEDGTADLVKTSYAIAGEPAVWQELRRLLGPQAVEILSPAEVEPLKAPSTGRPVSP